MGPARVSLRGLIGQLIGETFELDGRVPRTLVPFVVKPGFLTLEYTAGRRTKYTAPFRLFLAMGALWVVVAFSVSQWQLFHPGPEKTSSAEVRVDDPESPGEVISAMGCCRSSASAGFRARVRESGSVESAHQGV